MKHVNKHTITRHIKYFNNSFEQIRNLASITKIRFTTLKYSTFSFYQKLSININIKNPIINTGRHTRYLLEKVSFLNSTCSSSIVIIILVNRKCSMKYSIKQTLQSFLLQSRCHILWNPRLYLNNLKGVIYKMCVWQVKRRGLSSGLIYLWYWNFPPR